MAEQNYRVNDNTMITLPLRNIIAIVAVVGLAVTVYFELVEQLHEQKIEIMFLKERLERHVEKDFTDLYRRMGEIEDELVQPKHKH